MSKFNLESTDTDDQKLKDFAACVQSSIVRHIETRVHRAILFCDAMQKPQWRRTLVSQSTRFLPTKNSFIKVLSGGVASNSFLRQRIHDLCAHYGVELVCPPPQLCTDNGVMIAW